MGAERNFKKHGSREKFQGTWEQRVISRNMGTERKKKNYNFYYSIISQVNVSF